MIPLFLAKVTQVVIDSTSKLLQAQLRGDGDEGDNDSAEPADDAPFFPQFGVAVRPVVEDTLRALGVRFGDEVWLLKLWNKARHPTDLEEGETRVYSVKEMDARLRLRADGSVEILTKSNQPFKILANDAVIEITAAGAINITPKSGQDIKFNGGTAKVARVGTKTTDHNHSGTGMTAGPYPVNGNTQNTQPSVIDSGAADNVKA